MSEEKKTEKLGLADMLGEAGIDVSAVGLSMGQKHRSDCAFGIKEPISDVLLEFAIRVNRKSLWDVLDKTDREKMSKAAKAEAQKKAVAVIDWKIAKKAVFAEIDKMQKNLAGQKGKEISAEIAERYGVYRTVDGRFQIAQKTDQGRKPQMIGIVNRLGRVLESRGVDYLKLGDDKTGPVLIVEV